MKSIIILMCLLLVGCSEFGYETQWETDRRMCEKCLDSCGWDEYNVVWDEYMKSPESIEGFDNETVVKEYRECYADKCEWVCG